MLYHATLTAPSSLKYWLNQKYFYRVDHFWTNTVSPKLAHLGSILSLSRRYFFSGQHQQSVILKFPISSRASPGGNPSCTPAARGESSSIGFTVPWTASTSSTIPFVGSTPDAKLMVGQAVLYGSWLCKRTAGLLSGKMNCPTR